MNDLLTLARFDAEHLPADCIRFDIAQMCQELAEQFSLLAKEKSLTLTCQLPEPLYVMSDEERARQVIAILLDNAIKHSLGDDAQISLRAKRKKDTVEIVVQNTHPTIPEGKLSQLFERFYQADASYANKGTGLGLAIAHKIAHHMKWQLQVASANNTVAFTLTIPR